jgi:hypothetical protein
MKGNEAATGGSWLHLNSNRVVLGRILLLKSQIGFGTVRA